MHLDSRQIVIQKKMQQLACDLEKRASDGLIKKVFLKSVSKPLLKSLYIYGDVGRGKSMLMRGFFDSLKLTPKIYFHFNSFMRSIHEALRDIRSLAEKQRSQIKDELTEAVNRVVGKKSLLCFDEFQVVDIADAMLLSRIFSYLFGCGVVVVFTSNSQPNELYKNGLQRELFIEFVNNVLLKNCEILHLDSPIDYRSQCKKKSSKTFSLADFTKSYFVSNSKNRQKIKSIISEITNGDKPKSCKIKVWGREVKIKKTYRSSFFSAHDGKKNVRIAVFNFEEVCCVEFAASDYQAICQNFDLIFLLKVPKLKAEDVNEARRFVLFIDEVYENKTALILLAKTKAEKIYENGVGSESFIRAVSRLNEISSSQYWRASKINKKEV